MVLFSSPIFTEMILPFLLVFVLIFAILQKSKILGEGKAQIDALVSLAIALILIAFKTPRDIVVNLMPWLAVAAVVILVFMILYGFIAGELKTTPTWMKVVFGILIGIFVIAAVIWVTGFWATFKSWFSEGIFIDILFLAIIIGVVAAVIATGKKGNTSSSS